MIVIPAIDISQGKCVRLRQGDFNEMTIYHTDPVEVAKSFAHQGAELIHIVDLDAARTGNLANTGVVERIVQEVNIPIQFGGGLRTGAAVEEMLGLGVSRVVLGTVVYENPELVAELTGKYRERIIAGIDTRGGKLAVRGWQEVTEIPLSSALTTLQKCRVREVVYTVIERDGMLEGPDLSQIETILQTGLKVIISGGIGKLDDLRSLLEIASPGVVGAIVGKALYNGAFTLREAHSVLRKASCVAGRGGESDAK